MFKSVGDVAAPPAATRRTIELREERAGYIADFLKVPGGVLLASDAASRGLDFPKIDWIIQYDPPQRTGVSAVGDPWRGLAMELPMISEWLRCYEWIV